MKDRIVRLFIIVLGLLLAVSTILLFLRDISRVINWSSSGFVLSSLGVAQNGTVFFWQADSNDFIGENVPLKADTLITIGDSTATLRLWIDSIELPHPPGKEVEMTYLHDREQYHTTIKSRPVKRSLFIMVVILMAFRLLIFAAFITLAYWAFLKRPESEGIRVLALYSFCMAAFMGNIYMPMFVDMSSFRIPFENILMNFLGLLAVLFSSFWLLLNNVFPRRSWWMRKYSLRVYIFCFLPQLILAPLSFTAWGNQRWFGFAVFGVIVLQIALGHLKLNRNHFKADNNLEKRQTKLVFWGSGASLLLLLIYLLNLFRIVPYLNNLNIFPRLLLTNIIFLFLLVSPISFAYAFGKYRLLEIEGRLRRGTRYLMMLFFLFGLFFGIIYLIGVVFLQSMGVTSRTPTLLVALILALGFTPAQRSIRNLLEHRIFPERERLRLMTRDFLRIAATLPDLSSLCELLEERLKKNLGVNGVYTALRKRGNGGFFIPPSEKVPLGEEGDLRKYFQQDDYPLLVDEAFASSKIAFNNEEKGWLESHQIALILPLKTHSFADGFIALSGKNDQEDFHPEELQILSSLSSQAALAIENLRLLEENLEKRRMEEELQIARRVQMKFLPLEIPETPGLEVQAKSAFCREVAGDLYDVIPLKDGKTALAIGDVSGKGAGAALIMANLQASLRSLCGVGLSLPEMLKRINEIIHSNTESDQYITFFIGIFDQGPKTLNYVNAGHNPPILVRTNGSCEYLQTGGTILGAFPDIDFEEGEVDLTPGDMLLLYTDGVSETLNEAGEEFGIKRIEAMISDERGTSSAEIIEQLVAETEKFRGNELLEDDMTLMVVKVL